MSNQSAVDNAQTEPTAPLVGNSIPAGFPSPAEDFTENKLDLNEHLIRHPAATFFIRVEGNSMQDANITSGDLLIVDKALEARHGSIVVAIINGEFTVKQLYTTSFRTALIPANPLYKAIEINEAHELDIWGVVTHIIHKTPHTS